MVFEWNRASSLRTFAGLAAVVEGEVHALLFHVSSLGATFAGEAACEG